MIFDSVYLRLKIISFKRKALAAAGAFFIAGLSMDFEIKAGSKTIAFTPTLEIIEALEETFGSLQSLLSDMKTGQIGLRTHAEFMMVVFRHYTITLDDADINALIKTEGLAGIMQRNIKVLAACLMGIEAIKSFFDAGVPSLGKPQAPDGSILKN